MNRLDIPTATLIYCFLALASLLSACQSPADQTHADKPVVDKPAIGSDEDISQRWKAILQKEETPEVMEKKRQLYIEIMRRESDSRTHDFDVSGTVVDEVGRPLEDVTIAYSYSTRTGWEKEKKDGGQKQVDGGFQLKDGKWQTLNFTLRKKGYYDESFSFSGPPAEQMLDSILKGEKPNTRKVKVDDLVVTLVKQGEMTRLREYGRTVGVDHGGIMHTFYRADGSGVAINLSDGPGRRGWKPGRDWSPEDTWADVPNLNDPGPAPPLLVYVRAGTVNNVIPQEVEWTYLEVSFRRGSGLLPKHITLNVNDLDGGFIYHPVNEIQELIDDRFNRGMRQAPETGYQQTLTITPDMKIPVYFFIKAGDRYGKGVLRNVEVAEDGSRIDCETKLYMQDDGSRNLETLRFGPR